MEAASNPQQQEAMTMPYKRRGGSKTREPQITAAAVTLYERGKRLIRRGEEQHRDELLGISRELAVELKLKPWWVCPLDTIGFDGPSQWEGDSWWQSAAIADGLEEALRERRRAQRAARKAINGASNQPVPPAA